MFQKPGFFAPEHAEVFKHRGIVSAYQHRPPYPKEVFTTLAELIHTEPHLHNQLMITLKPITLAAASHVNAWAWSRLKRSMRMHDKRYSRVALAE